MKKILVFLLMIISAISLTSCKKVAFDESKGVIKIGLECEYAPFNWTELVQTDTNVPIKGKVSAYAEGYDIMMAKVIAEKLGYKLEVYQFSFDGLIVALNNGSIDLIIAGMSPTEKRKQSINFSDAYYRSEHVLLLKKNSKYASAKTFDDLDNALVVGQRGTLYDTLAKQIAEKNKTVKYQNPLDTISDIIIPLTSGAIDITILEEPVAKGIVSANPDFTYIKLESNFDVKDEDLDVAIGIRKVDTNLLEQVNEALSTISQEQRNAFMQRAIELQGN